YTSWYYNVIHLLFYYYIPLRPTFLFIARYPGNRLAAEDALDRLHRAGLIHRLDKFVWATRAALHAKGLGM
ncbi:MAG: hypothetical protein ACTHO8_06510, partial [Solirubrobacterales bacterium]